MWLEFIPHIKRFSTYDTNTARNNFRGCISMSGFTRDLQYKRGNRRIFLYLVTAFRMDRQLNIHIHNSNSGGNRRNNFCYS